MPRVYSRIPVEERFWSHVNKNGPVPVDRPDLGPCWIWTVTRRDWNAKHAAKFKAGMLVDAWNTSPRNVKGNPHKIAILRLTTDPYQEMSNLVEERTQAHADDYGAEGFYYLDKLGLQGTVDGILLDWEENPRDLYVVRFEVVEYLEGPLS